MSNYLFRPPMSAKLQKFTFWLQMRETESYPPVSVELLFLDVRSSQHSPNGQSFGFYELLRQIHYCYAVFNITFCLAELDV